MIARSISVPKDALLHRYVDKPGAYTDCFEVMSPLSVTHVEFIEAFYTTWLFRLERVILAAVLCRGVSDTEVIALAEGREDNFAVWTVEDRMSDQILLQDASGQTCSYLAVVGKEGGVTHLIFGSAVFAKTGEMPLWIKALIPAHRFYSKALLRLAEWKIRKG